MFRFVLGRSVGTGGLLVAESAVPRASRSSRRERPWGRQLRRGGTSAGGGKKPPQEGKSRGEWLSSTSERWEKVAEVADEESRKAVKEEEEGKVESPFPGLKKLMSAGGQEEAAKAKLKADFVLDSEKSKDPWADSPMLDENPDPEIVARMRAAPKHLTAETSQGPVDRAEQLKKKAERLDQDAKELGGQKEELEEAVQRTEEETAWAIDDAALVVGEGAGDLMWSSSGAYAVQGETDDILELNEDNFEQRVEEEQTPLLIDCWSPTCTDSVAATVLLRLLVKCTNSGPKGTLLKLLSLQSNLNYHLVLHLGVNALPTAIAVQDREVLEQQTGMVDEEQAASFVFGFVTAMHGDDALDHLSEDNIICKLIDGRAALKAKDFETAWEKYSQVRAEAMAEVEKEVALREEEKEKGIFTPELARPLSDSEVLAAKATVGMLIICYNRKQFRHCKKLLNALETDLKKAYTVLADVQKAASTIDILMLSGYRVDDDILNLEDEERIDQHNLDLKVRLAGAYFMGGEYTKSLSTCCILIRKNYRWRGNAGLHMARRIMRYLGKHHAAVEDYAPRVEDAMRMKYSQDFRWNARLNAALNQPGDGCSGVLAHEIPKMISPAQFENEKSSRHPLLR
eukprot:Hpha_TRINITY_DN15498_c3_g1::TRINITY_DN15498_c3_g1_i1::g.173101::m.173101